MSTPVMLDDAMGTEIVVRLDDSGPERSVTLRWRRPSVASADSPRVPALRLPCRGFLSDQGIQYVATAPAAMVTTFEPRMVASRRQAGLTIGETEALITDANVGKYPHRTPNRDELVRSLRIAATLWGAETRWADIEDGHWTTLYRRRLEGLLAKDCDGWRATEITVGRLITTVRWLRAKKHIPIDAAAWPDTYKQDIKDHWKGITKSVRDPQPFRPRYTLEESRAILAKTDFDPRFQLLMWLGMELRLGQVVRMRRTDLGMPPVDFAAPVVRDENGRDPNDYGTMTVHGAGKKGGVTTDLTRGQRLSLERAFTDGYLAEIEKQFQAGAVEDYVLFPAGYVVGRVGFMREKSTVMKLGKVDYNTNATGSWVRKNFRVAEARAGIEHIAGRCGYGVRRLGRDFADEAGLSTSAIENWGSWTPGSPIPNQVYRDRANRAGRREARGARAAFRGEEE